MGEKQKSDSELRSKPSKELKDAPLPPFPFTRSQAKPTQEESNSIEKIVNKEEALSIDEATKLLEDLRSKQEMLRMKLEEMYKERGVTPEFLESYLSNPSNFTEEQWKNMQEHRQFLYDSLKLEPQAIEAETKESFLNPTSKTVEGERSKERRKKEGAAQRRGWLPMR